MTLTIVTSFSISIISFDLGLKPETIVRLKQQLHDGRNYLKLKFKTHISQNSRIADHCSTFAVSDPNDSSWREKCDHDHDEEYNLIN
jgi:hypothetical protein